MRKRYIWTAVTVFYILFIFSNSMKPADVSSLASGKTLSMVQEILTVSGVGSQWLTEHIIRKTAHFTEYALLGALLFGCIKAYGFQVERRWFVHITAGYIVPFVDETIQLFVSGRSGQISDVWLDCAGVVSGTLFAASLLLIWKRTEKIYDKKLSNNSAI